MRAAGCDHGIEKRRSMCGRICEPSPRMKRPCESACRSLPSVASSIGVRAKAIAIAVESSSRVRLARRQHQRKERIVRPLEREAAVVAELFEPLRLAPRAGEILRQQRAVDLQHGFPLSSARTAAAAAAWAQCSPTLRASDRAAHGPKNARAPCPVEPGEGLACQRASVLEPS